MKVNKRSSSSRANDVIFVGGSNSFCVFINFWRFELFLCFYKFMDEQQ